MPIEILKKLPKAARDLWESAFKTAKAKYGDERAGKIAWAAVKNRFKKVDGMWTARTEDFTSFKTVHYEFVADEASLTRSDDGHSYIDYVLATSNKAADGFKLSGLALKNFAEKINLEGLVGRIDSDGKHSYLHELEKKGLSPEEIEEQMKSLETGIRAIKATYDPKGRVTARLKIANNLVKDVLKYHSASAEFRVPNENFKGDLITNASITGFVLTNSPADPNAVRVGISG